MNFAKGGVQSYREIGDKRRQCIEKRYSLIVQLSKSETRPKEQKVGRYAFDPC
jgi:hypothetical protein